MAEQKESKIQAIFGVVVAIGAAWYFFVGSLEKQAAKDMGKIEQQVANDSVEQYQIAKRNGSPMDVCVHAGMVSAAYLQAKDEPNYKTWKAIEKVDCLSAGIVR